MTRIISFFLEFAVVVVLIFAQNVTKKIFGAQYDHSFSKIPSIMMNIFVLEKKKKKLHHQLFHLYTELQGGKKVF